MVWFYAGAGTLWVEFADDEATWVGVFGMGGIIKDGGLVVPFSTGDHFLVIAGGQGYVVDAAGRTAVYKTTCDYLSGAMLVPQRNLIVGWDFTRLYGFGTARELWQTGHIGSDNIRINSVHGSELVGAYWQTPQAWWQFKFNVDKLAMTENKFLSHEWDHFR